MARCRRVVALALALVVVSGVLGPVQPVQADLPFKDPVWLMETLDSLGYPAYHNLGFADVSLDGGRYLSEGHLYDVSSGVRVPLVTEYKSDGLTYVAYPLDLSADGSRVGGTAWPTAGLPCGHLYDRAVVWPPIETAGPPTVVSVDSAGEAPARDIALSGDGSVVSYSRLVDCYGSTVSTAHRLDGSDRRESSSFAFAIPASNADTFVAFSQYTNPAGYTLSVTDRNLVGVSMVSVTPGGAKYAAGEGVFFQDVRISPSGRFVAFATNATNASSADQSNDFDVYVRDRDPDADGLFDEGDATTRLLWSVTDSDFSYVFGVTDNGLVAGATRDIHIPIRNVSIWEVRVADSQIVSLYRAPSSMFVGGGAVDEAGRIFFEQCTDTDCGLYRLDPVESSSFYVFDFSALFGSHRFFGVADDPVNTASGNFIQSEIDLSFGSSVFGLEWSRAYNSQDDSVGVMGRGWLSSFETAVLSDDSGEVRVRLGNGRQVVFEPDDLGGFLRPDGVYANLVVEADGSYRLDGFGGVSWDFDLQGRLVGLSFWNGQVITVTHGPDGPTSVESSTGRSLSVAYVGGQVSTVTGDDGRTVTYMYDSAGLLSSVTDTEGGTMTYGYTPEGWLASVTDSEGVLVAANSYDPNGRVVYQKVGGGASASFSYDDSNGETTVTSQPSGEVTVYRHNPAGYLVGLVDAFGNSVSMTRRDDGELVRAMSRLGESLSQTLDPNGNVLSSSTITGGTISYTYDGLNRVTSATSAFGATTTYGYEELERIPSMVTDGLGNVTTIDVVDGLVFLATDADGVTTAFSYDTEGRLVSETNGVGDVTAYSYDTAGRLLQIISPLGNVTSFSYDAEGRLLTSTDPTGAVTTNSFDLAGRLLSVTDPEGAPTTYAYDSSGRLASVTDSRGAVTIYAYDAFNQLTDTTRPGDSVSQNIWEELGRLQSSIDPVSRVMSYGYDADGNRVLTTDPTGDVTQTPRDSAGRVTSVTDPLGRTTLNSYDAFGRLASITDPTGATVSYAYDSLGRVDMVTDQRGGEYSTGFTAAGRVDFVTDPNGNVISYSYDGVGRVSSVMDAEGGVTTYTYDADGRVVATTSPAGLVTTVSYDAVGRPVTVTDPAGVAATFRYDGRGDLVMSQTAGDGVVSFNYDDRDLRSVSDALGNTTSFGYDHRGNRVTMTDALGRVQSATFNNADERTSVADALGRVSSVTYDGDGRTETAADPSGRTVTSGYDGAGQLVTQAFADGTQISYTYDAAGRRVTMTDTSGVTSYGYDAAGNLTSITYPNLDTLTYTYDAGGRRSSMTYPDGSTVLYGYDGNSRLVSVTHSTAGTTNYSYDADGRLLSEALPDGTTRSYGYTEGRLTAYTQNGVTTTIVYEASGRIAATSGGENWTFAYDQAGQLTAATDDISRYSYAYDAVGNLISKDGVDFTVDVANQLVSSSDGSTFAYDEAGRFVEEVRGDGSRRGFSYDARGLLVQQVEATAGIRGAVTDPCVTAVATITGTEGDDVLAGTNGDDVIFGLGGHDWIDGGSGADLICAGDGDDTVLDGGNGPDTIVGGVGNDTLDGGRGVDLIIGGDGDDALSGNLGNDSLFGGPGVDVLDGGSGDDTIYGDDGADTLTGDKGNDTLQGGPDADIITGGMGDDHCETETGRVDCELDLEDGDPEQTVYTRSYDGDGLLTQVVVTNPDGSVDVHDFIWDKNLPVPQIVVHSINGDATELVYGTNRGYAVDDLGTASAFEYSVLGDVTGGHESVSSGFDPYGQPETTTTLVGFGYRSELHIGGDLYLRLRDLDPATGRLGTVDPVRGVLGTTTVTNRYVYADNDPVSNVDPLGLRATDGGFSLWGVSGSEHTLAASGLGASSVPEFTGLFGLSLGIFGWEPMAATWNPRRFSDLAAYSYECVGFLECLGAHVASAASGVYDGAVSAYNLLVPVSFEANELGPVSAGTGAAHDAAEFGTEAYISGQAIRGTFFVLRRLSLIGRLKPATNTAGLADDVVIVRGGQSDIPAPGEVFSGAYGSTAEDAAAFVPHGSIRATTAGDIRASGGTVDVVPELTRSGVWNERHVNICLGSGPCPFPDAWVPNPVPKAGRIR